MVAFAALCASLGALIAVGMVSLCGGYIMAVAVLERFSKTVLGTHVRHFFVRMSPPKRFDLCDARYVERIVRDALRKPEFIKELQQ